MKTTTVEIAKKDVELLDVKELQSLISPEAKEAIKVLAKMANNAVSEKILEASSSISIPQEEAQRILIEVAVMREAWIFLLDVPMRAQKRLGSLKEQ